MGSVALLHEMVAAAGLPAVKRSAPLEQGIGLDNTLTWAVLADGREVLLRVNEAQGTSPRRRAAFLEACRVGAPRLYAANDGGASLVAFIPGRPLADLVAAGLDDARAWALTGAAFARVHSVTFPTPLQGEVGPASILLEPLDPVDQLEASIEASEAWLSQHRPHIVPALARLRLFVEVRAADIRSETPCLIHGDANLQNIIVGADDVHLIDWDFPEVRYPLAELSALDEHVYLNGGSELPAAFFTGYGRNIVSELLLAYRIVGCLGSLRGDDWAQWDSNPSITAAARERLHRWQCRLLQWVDRLPELSRQLAI